jgi:predicted transposase YbfD/YdcC
VFAVEPDAVDFPFARSIVAVQSHVLVTKSGRESTEVRFYLSSLSSSHLSATQWHRLIRGHWAGAEIRNHWKRDALWGEDKSRTRNKSALANLASLRNCLLATLADLNTDLPLPEQMEAFASNPTSALHSIRHL